MKHFFSDEVDVSLPRLFGLGLKVKVNYLLGLPPARRVRRILFPDLYPVKPKNKRFFNSVFTFVIGCGIINNRLAKTVKHQ